MALHANRYGLDALQKQERAHRREHRAGHAVYRAAADGERVDPVPEFERDPPGRGRGPDPELFSSDDPFGWHVGEFEEALELRAGLAQVGRQVLGRLGRLLDGERVGTMVVTE